MNDPKSKIETWAPLVIGIWTQTLLAAALALAVMHQFPEGALMLLLGVVATNATAGVQFYFGSSAGSKKKDDRLDKQSDQLSASVPVSAISVAPKAGA